MNSARSKFRFETVSWLLSAILPMLFCFDGCAGGRQFGKPGHNSLSHAEFDRHLILQLDDIISNLPEGVVLNEPASMATTARGRLAILDREPPRIVVLDRERQAVQIAAGAGDYQVSLRRPRFIRSGFGLTLEVTDEAGRVLIFDNELRFISSFEPSYEASGFAGGSPSGLAVSGMGDTYLADRANDVVYHFDPSGKFVTTVGGAGSGIGRLNRPEGLAITEDDRLVVCDAGAARVVVFDAAGEYLLSLGDREMRNPVAAAVAPNNAAVFVCEGKPPRLALYNLDGRLIQEWNGSETAIGGFGQLADVVIDGQFLYVVDEGNPRILVFRMIPGGR
jgi:DNA-binding beta-propeller fold protein YncE